MTCGQCAGGAYCDIITGDCSDFPCGSGWQGGRCDVGTIYEVPLSLELSLYNDLFYL